jgi:polysaccharide pyruvyl transferase WcaK-like protein
VGALTVSNIAIVEKVARELGISVRFKVLGWKDPRPAYVTGPNIEVLPLRARTILEPSGLYAAVRDCHLVLDISAGDSFADIYGSRRFLFNILSKFVVLAARRPLILSPQTIGPFERWWTKVLAGRAMHSAAVVVTRDGLSSDYVRSFGISETLVEATDVAFRLPYSAPEKRPEGPVRVGLNISGLLFNGGYTQKNMFGLACDYPEVVRRLCAIFSTEKSCELHLVGHVNSHDQPVEDDYRVCEALVAEFPGTKLAPRFADPSAAKSYISGLDFFAGSRMHACIAAFSSGVPVLPMAYSRKFAGLFNTLGYHRLADCRAQPTETIVSEVIEAYRQREALRTEVDSGRNRAEERLAKYEAVLRKAMLEAIGAAVEETR